MQSPKKSSIVFSLNAKMNFKIIVVGNKFTGKTSLILRQVKDTYEQNYKVTVGVQFYSKVIQDEDDEIALQIWDTAGQQTYKSIVKSFYHFANCVMLVYDSPLNLRQNLTNWLKQINEHISEGTRVIIIRTKIDLVPIEQDEQKQIESLKEDFKIEMFRGVSAKTAKNVAQVFIEIAELMKYLFNNDYEFRSKIDQSLNSLTSDGSILKNKLTSLKQNSNKSKKCCNK